MSTSKKVWLVVLLLTLFIHTSNSWKKCCQIQQPFDKTWGRVRKKTWRREKKTCKNIRNPTTCNSRATCIFDCDCDLAKHHNDIIQKIEFQGMAKDLYGWKNFKKQPKWNWKSTIGPPDKLRDLTEQEYVSGVSILAVNREGLVYKLTLDATKFNVQKPVDLVSRRLLTIADVTAVNLQNPPYHSSGALIHYDDGVHGTGTVISSYNANWPGRAEGDFSWIITAGHVLYELNSTKPTHGVLPLNKWIFYQGLNDNKAKSKGRLKAKAKAYDRRLKAYRRKLAKYNKLSKAKKKKRKKPKKPRKSYINKMDDAVCVYVSQYAQANENINLQTGRLDWGLIKFRGKSNTQLNIAFDNNMNTWPNPKNMLMATYKYPMHKDGSYKMQKMSFPLARARLNTNLASNGVEANTIQQSQYTFFGGMSGSGVVRDHGNKDNIYGVVIWGSTNNTQVAKHMWGYMSRITQAKKQIIDRLTIPIIVIAAHQSDYNEYNSYFDRSEEYEIYASYVVYSITLMVIMVLFCIFSFGCGAIFGYASSKI
eukprot:390367_1